MTTPQPMKHAPSQQGKTPQPSQHGAAATPGASASTPYSNLHAFSPHGPRSSPQQFKKSPATSGTLVGSNSQAGPAPMNFDSPSAAALFGGFDLASDNMGMGAMGLPRPSGDEERQKRLEEVTHILGQKKGIVSDEGLERLTKRVGLVFLWEENPGVRMFVIAGDTVALEIGMKDHVVQTVSLQFPVSGPSVTKYASKAEAIILDDLKLAPNQHPWTKTLDKFAANLERLAALDKLSVLDKDSSKPHIVTHDAVAGLHESLDKLHDWDIKKLREDPELSQKGDDHIRTLAMCERNGQSVMHERGHVGMCLNYWREQRFYIPRSEEARDNYRRGKMWGILIGCAERNALVYSAPVRISNQWIADEIELPAADGLQVPMLNWQEPPECFLPGSEGVQPENDPLALSGPKLADVMFMATLDPPVTLPSSVCEEMHHLTGAPPPHLNPAFMHTFDYLIFPPEGEYSAAEPRMITTERKVKAFTKDKKPAPKTHENRLFIHKPVYGQTLTELPFSHPSQLVNMLPTLRQYAFLWNLLDKAFGKDELEDETPKTEGKIMEVIAKSDEFQTWMNSADKKTNADAQKADHPMTGTPSDQEPVKIDVTLNAHPQPNPKLQIMFPFRGRPAQITVDIERNGVVQVESTNIVDDEGRVLDESGRPVEGAVPNPLWKKERLGRRLMFFEDIGLWCEWIRNYMGA
ncbi:hypothetical protein VM1G_08436 [Cytospora mali]|uniref:Mediator of RNA polymerase II transcription subunit 1 n=1 Tax=Cytospora mali TaxID=578113 RepID=A0A194W9N6_CYTMA|nr:hypothetical protein VM1G_08436 [Valsa mali]